MPQGNLETLVSACAGGSCDRKIACETLAADDDEGEAKEDHMPPQNPQEEEIPPDFPPESFWLSKDAELDWFDRNAFYERKDSQKGNSVSNSTNLNPNIHPNSNSTSQRFLKKSKASMIGLPKPQKSCFVDTKNRRPSCKPANARLFPKRSGSVNKSDPPLVEPSSPKVSCMGRVRSKRDRNRRLKNRQAEAEKVKGKSKERRRTGFFSSIRSIFRSNGKQRATYAPAVDSPPRDSVSVTGNDIRRRLPPGDADAISLEASSPPRRSMTEPVGLGGMMRFSSGRRSEPLI